MSFYKKQFNERHNVWYPEAVTVGSPVETRKIADRLAQISTVSRADVLAVLAELPGVMADYMAQGKSVRLNGLGTFRYTLDTKGVATEEEFDFQAQVKAVRVSFIPAREGAVTRGGTATRPLVPQDIEWQEWLGRAEEASADDTEEPGGNDDSGEDGGL